MSEFKVGDKVKFIGISPLSKIAVNPKTGYNFRFGDIAIVSAINNTNCELRLNYGMGNWVTFDDIELV